MVLGNILHIFSQQDIGVTIFRRAKKSSQEFEGIINNFFYRIFGQSAQVAWSESAGWVFSREQLHTAIEKRL